MQQVEIKIDILNYVCLTTVALGFTRTLAPLSWYTVSSIQSLQPQGVQQVLTVFGKGMHF